MLRTGTIGQNLVRVFVEGRRGVAIYRQFEQYWSAEGKPIVREECYHNDDETLLRRKTLDQVRAQIDKKLGDGGS